MDRRQALALGFSLIGCGQARAVRVGAKNFTEQDILGALLGEAIQRFAKLPADLNLHLGGSLIAHNALIAGDLDLYPEYSATALTACLKLPLEKDPDRVFAAVQQAYAQRHQVQWGWPLGFSNNFAMVVRADHPCGPTLSSAVASGPWRLGVGYEFEQRPDGWQAMRNVYPLPLNGGLKTMDLGLLFRALDANEVDMIAANSTDPQLASGRYRLLSDDKQFWAPYQACVAVRQDALARWPQVKNALDALAGKIDEAAMRKLNSAVVLEKRSAETVAHEFAVQLWGT
jgi:osmoprotectant transport system substrate-binding protein